MQNVIARVEQESCRQHEVIGVEQARRLGLPRPWAQRLTDAGRWSRLLRGMYWTRPVGTPPPLTLATAALLFAGGGIEPTGVVADVLAARLLGLDTSEVPVRPVVVLPAVGWRHQPHGLRYAFGGLGSGEVVAVSGVRCTSVARTLQDLSIGSRFDELLVWVDAGLRRGLLAGGCLPAASRDLRAALAHGSPLAESPFESRVRAELITAGLPAPVLQHVVRAGGQFVARVDLAWPDVRLAVEADGAGTHTGAEALRRDLRRQNALIDVGWTPLRFVWADLGSIAPRVRTAPRSLAGRPAYLHKVG